MNFVCSSGFCWWWCLEMRTLNRSDQGLKAYSCLNLCAQGPFLALLGDHVCCGGCIPLQLCARKERYPLYDLVPTMDSKWNQRRSSFSADILVDIYLREYLFQTLTWEGWGDSRNVWALLGLAILPRGNLVFNSSPFHTFVLLKSALITI